MPPLDIFGLQARRGSTWLTYAVSAIRLLILATLAVLEPLIRFTLTTLATLGVFVTIVFGFQMATKGFPTWFILGMSIGCFLLLAAYYAVLRSFVPVSDEPGLR